MSNTGFQIEKYIWSDADFEKMNWHDNLVYAFTFQTESYRLLLDIDYVCRWNEPVPPSNSFTYWIAPATLVFETVQAVKIDIEMKGISDIILWGIRREKPSGPWSNSTEMWQWHLEGNEGGDFRFHASGYKMYIRKKPVFSEHQALTLEERGGISFDCPQNLI